MFKSIHIKNFRGIKELEIDDFKQVNLFVGANNSGKTSVLEALYISLDPNNPGLSDSSNKLRGMSPSSFRIEPNYADMSRAWGKTIQSLFYELNTRNLPLINCSFTDKSKETQQIELSLSVDEELDQNKQPDLIYNFHSTAKSLKSKKFQSKLISEKALINTGQSQYTEGMVVKPIIDDKYKELRFQKRAGRFISAKLLNDIPSLKVFFDEVIETTKKKNKLIRILQQIEPKLIGIVFTHAFFVELSGFNEAIRLESLGDGTLKLFALALICICDEKDLKNGFLFIDELENGLHYVSQSIIWNFLFDFQKEFSTQVFITTHSMDCVKAFVESGRNNEDSMVFRLEKDKADEVKAIPIEPSSAKRIAEKNGELR